MLGLAARRAVLVLWERGFSPRARLTKVTALTAPPAAGFWAAFGRSLNPLLAWTKPLEEQSFGAKRSEAFA